MKKMVIGLMILGLAGLGYSQELDKEMEEVVLKEVVVKPFNRTYFATVKQNTKSGRVLVLERKAAYYNIEHSPKFAPGADLEYRVHFEQLDGRILAIFDSVGKILNTFEQYEDIVVPDEVVNYLYREYPDWTVDGNTYVVNYTHNKAAKKIFNIDISKEEKRKRIKLDHMGNEIQ